MVWSEGIFGLALVATVLQTERYLRAPTRAARWTLTALAAAGPLIRFMGLALPIGVAVVLVVLGRGSLSRRYRDAALVAGLALVPVGAWIKIAGIGRGSGSLRWHPPPGDAVLDGFMAIGRWVGLPDDPARVAGVVIVAAAAVMAVVWCRRARLAVPRSDHPEIDTVGAVALLLAGTVVVVVVLARTLVDTLIRFDARMLAPIHLLAAIVVPFALSLVSRPWRHVAVALGLVLVSLGLRETTSQAERYTRFNTTYSGNRWEHSPTMAAIAALPPGTVIATNAPDAVWIRTGRTPLMLPLPTDLYGGGPNPDVPEQSAVLARALQGHDAVVVFFDRPTQGGRRTLDHRVASTLHLEVKSRYADGTTYRPGDP
jgi:hypothetical protein